MTELQLLINMYNRRLENHKEKTKNYEYTVYDHSHEEVHLREEKKRILEMIKERKSNKRDIKFIGN